MDKLKKRNKAVTRNSGMSPKLNRKGWAFVLPAFILILIFVFYPMVQSFLLSLKTGMGSNLTFTGLDNYKRLLTDETFKKALFNTVLYLIIQVPIMILLADGANTAPVLVFDILDLWPEALGIGKLQKLWPFQCWKRLRDDHLKAADLVITECHYFQKFICNRWNY